MRSLAQTLGVSVSTIRRDLDDMAASGVVRRVHGGVVLIAGEELRAEGVMIERAVANTAAKGRIAAAAARLVTPGSTIFVSGGTTTERLVPHLAGVASLTVITNAVDVGPTIDRTPSGVEAIVLGGLAFRAHAARRNDRAGGADVPHRDRLLRLLWDRRRDRHHRRPLQEAAPTTS